MPSSLGSPATTVFLKSEADPMAHEFAPSTGQTVHEGEPVKLANDGTIIGLAAGDDQNLFIGSSMHTSSTTRTRVTINTRAFALLNAQAHANSQNAGPVEYDSFDTGTGLAEFTAASTSAKTIGWAIDAATTANDPIRVLMKK